MIDQVRLQAKSMLDQGYTIDQTVFMLNVVYEFQSSDIVKEAYIDHLFDRDTIAAETII